MFRHLCVGMGRCGFLQGMAGMAASRLAAASMRGHRQFAFVAYDWPKVAPDVAFGLVCFGGWGGGAQAFCMEAEADKKKLQKESDSLIECYSKSKQSIEVDLAEIIQDPVNRDGIGAALRPSQPFIVARA